MRAGDRVRHRLHGSGTVLDLRVGLRAKIRFDAAPNLPRTVSRRDLEALERDAAPPGRPRATSRGQDARVAREARASARPSGNGRVALPGARVVQAPAPPPPASAEELADLRQTIEALRLGVVPARHVKEYTVARDREIASLEGVLGAGGGFRLLWGDYGNGKTHLLEVAERIALERGLVTSRVTLDPVEVSPAHPKRLYRAIVSSLTYPGDGGRGLEPLMDRLEGSPDHRSPGGDRFSRFFSPYLFALERGDEELVGWVRDYVNADNMDGGDVDAVLRRFGWTGPRILALSDFRTYGRLYVHMVGTLAAWARDAGFRGLVLLLDEVEGIDQYPRVLAEYARQALMHFAAVAVPREHLSFDPDSHGELYRGGHSVHRDIPLKFRTDQPLGVVFAMTPLAEIEAVFRSIVSSEGYGVPLAALTEADTAQLRQRIVALYRRAHPAFAFPRDGSRRLAGRIDELLESGAGSPRDVVRWSVFLLDELRLARRIA